MFVFNSAGYYALYTFAKHRHDRQFAEKLDLDEYSGSDAIIVKIPFTMPYAPNFTGYERVNGEFVSNGETYKMVKQNVVKDTLYVVMVKDKQTAAMKDALADFTESSGAKSKSTPGITDSVSKDFISGQCQLFTQSMGWASALLFLPAQASWLQVDAALSSPPPKAIIA